MFKKRMSINISCNKIKWRMKAGAIFSGIYLPKTVKEYVTYNIFPIFKSLPNFYSFQKENNNEFLNSVCLIKFIYQNKLTS